MSKKPYIAAASLLILIGLFCGLAESKTHKTQRDTMPGDVAFAMGLYKQKHGRYPHSWEELDASGALHPETREAAIRLLKIDTRYVFFANPPELTPGGDRIKVLAMPTDGKHEGAREKVMEDGSSEWEEGRFVIVELPDGRTRPMRFSEKALNRMLGDAGFNLLDYTARSEGGNWLPEKAPNQSDQPSSSEIPPAADGPDPIRKSPAQTPTRKSTDPPPSRRQIAVIAVTLLLAGYLIRKLVRRGTRNGNVP